MESPTLAPGCDISCDISQAKRLEITNNESFQCYDEKIEPTNEQGDTVSRNTESHSSQIKDRITQCRNIIETLKSELMEEKAKIEKENTISKSMVSKASKEDFSYSTKSIKGLKHDTNTYSACVDSKLACDENLMEYEKQLQKYQNTLNMAQIEKKNAIRKQMLAKAYKLKLLEVENQCNIELLRVKQSLQCLEPLKMIANKWNDNDDATYDLNNFDLIPKYLGFDGNYSSVDVKSVNVVGETSGNDLHIKEEEYDI